MTNPSMIERITRSLAYMLRHNPEEFDIELDRFGSADCNEVVQVLNERLGEPIDEEDLEDAIEAGDRARYAIDKGRVRALYGHSIEVDPGESEKPQELLYVGLGSRDAERAERYGLRAGRRAFLHLAKDEAQAIESGRRQARHYVVVTVYALDAWEQGLNFYDRGSLYLSDPIPTEFLELGDVYEDGSPPSRDGGRDRGRGGRDRGGRDRDRGGRGRGRDRDESRGRDENRNENRDENRGETRDRDQGRDDSRNRDRGNGRGQDRDEGSRRPARAERDGGQNRRPERDDERPRTRRDSEERAPRREERAPREERPKREARPRREEPVAQEQAPAPKPAAAKPSAGFGRGLEDAPPPVKTVPQPPKVKQEVAAAPTPAPAPAPKPEPKKPAGPAFGTGL